ncbi:MAG: DUF3180 domain-containing protein [Candidatus Nanopelagicales bacterium]|nr:DUF3180 domain-containing protein [Candidatus Nanopelagicales bacterium]
MTPTRIRLLLVLAVLAGAIGWAVAVLVSGQAGRVVPVTWLAPLTLWFLAVALLVWALLARPKLQRRPGSRRMAPLVAARTAALAMAASRTGALVAGFYLGLAVGTLPSQQTPAGSESLWAAALSTAGAVALVAAALWLEHLCRLPSDGDGDDTGLGRVSA